MNIVYAYLISLIFSFIGNTILLKNFINEIKNKRLEISFKNKKFKQSILKEIILFLIPIINLLNTLYLTVNFLNNSNKAINYLKDNEIIIDNNSELSNPVNYHPNIIRNNLKEEINYCFIKYSELIYNDEQLRLVRKKIKK